MSALKQQIGLLADLKRQREILAFRYYTSNDQSTVINLIANEIENWPQHMELPEELFIKLSNPEKLATDNIGDLCNIYREIIIEKIQCENI